MESRRVRELCSARNWDAVLERLATDEGRREASEIHAGSGRLLLHRAPLLGAPVEVVRTLLDAYLEGARITDATGRLPLHYAVMARGQMEVVRVLLDAYPEGVGMTDNFGGLPLHYYVARAGASVEIVRTLLDAYPEAAGMTDNINGRLPLHYAAERDAPVEEVVRVLLDAHPGAANIRDNKGRTPGNTSNSDNHPKVHVMLGLARAGYPPNRPWTTRTHSVLRGIAASVGATAASALIDAHVLRVRTLLCTLHRHGIPFALVSSIVGKVYVSDFFE